MLTSKAKSLVEAKLQQSDEAKEFMAAKIIYSDIAKQIRAQHITPSIQAKMDRVIAAAKDVGVVCCSSQIFDTSTGLYGIKVAGESRSFLFISESGYSESLTVPDSDLIRIEDGSELHLKIIEADKIHDTARDKFNSYHFKLVSVAAQAPSLAALKKSLAEF